MNAIACPRRLKLSSSHVVDDWSVHCKSVIKLLMLLSTHFEARESIKQKHFSFDIDTPMSAISNEEENTFNIKRIKSK